MWASEDEEDGGRQGDKGRKVSKEEVKEMSVPNRLWVTVICAGLFSSVGGSDGETKG